MNTLLETKLFVPQPSAGMIVRSRFDSRLDLGLHKKLTLICAPAGFGKTTVAATWLRSISEHTPDEKEPRRIAWYALDEHDNDLHTFTAYLVGAIRAADRSLLDDWVDLDKRSATPGAEEAAAELAASLSRGLAAHGSGLVIALDDYHFIFDKQIHRFVDYLVRHLPPPAQLLLTTRFDPPFALAQLRVRDQISEVRAQQLAFSLEEAGAFLRETVSPELDEETVDTLWRQTEGWAAGLRLAAISMRSAEDRRRFVRSFAQNTNRYIADYLVDEVLASQPAAVQRFLLHTAVLERMCSDLCTAVAGSAAYQGQPMLGLLEQSGLFLVPLDEFGEWFRYHAQFRTMLLNRLRIQAAPAEVASLHMMAGDWFAGQGLAEEALQHYVSGGGYPMAVALLERQIPEIMRRERWRQAERWLALLPPEATRQRPALLLLQAWLCHRDLNYARVRDLVLAAERLLSGDPAQCASELEPAALEGQISTLRASTVYEGQDNEQRIAHGQAALRLLPPEFDWIRAFAINFLAQALAARNGLSAGLKLLETETRSAGRIENEFTLRLYFAEAALHYFHGSIDDLERTAQQFERLALKLDLPIHQQWANFALGSIHIERNQPEAALTRLAAVFARPDLAAFQTLHLAAGGLLQLYARSGNVAKGDQVLLILHQRLADNPDPLVHAEVEALAAAWALSCGDLPAAEAHVAGSGAEIPLLNVPYRGRVRVLIHQALGSPGDLAKAATIAERLAAAYGLQHHTRNQLAMLVLLAQTFWLKGKQLRGLETLCSALDLGYTLGFRSTFITNTQVMGEMLHKLAREDAYTEMAGNLLAEIRGATSTDEPPPPASTFTALNTTEGTLIIEPLSDRELEVLTLMARKLGNKEIAQLLTLSPLTVRNHAVRIYDKLKVDTRRQAVTRARQLGILPS